MLPLVILNCQLFFSLQFPSLLLKPIKSVNHNHQYQYNICSMCTRYCIGPFFKEFIFRQLGASAYSWIFYFPKQLCHTHFLYYGCTCGLSANDHDYISIHIGMYIAQYSTAVASQGGLSSETHRLQIQSLKMLMTHGCSRCTYRYIVLTCT